MRRTGFDEHRDQKTANEFLSASGVCRRCSAGADRQTLADYGGLCGSCFSAYCTGGKRNPPAPSSEQKLAMLAKLRSVMTTPKHPHSWVQRLQARQKMPAGHGRA